ncbi:MAG: DUF5946 family protein [bacterium]
MTATRESICPGCGLGMPASNTAVYDGYYNTSPECWEVYTEVLGSEFSNAVLFGQVHQMTVDTYAIQHAGGTHPDKSVTVHLVGLHVMFERGIRPPNVARYLQRLAAKIERWPHFPPPVETGALTVFDVALCGSDEEHANKVKEWAGSVWQGWSQYHAEVAALISHHLERA